MNGGSGRRRRIVIVGGGPGGLYTALLVKRADPAREVRVIERHRPAETFGFGVVLSQGTLDQLGAADPGIWSTIVQSAARWDAIDIHNGDAHVRVRGHSFVGLGRQQLLAMLHDACTASGVELTYETEVADPEAIDSDLVVAADGAYSGIRTRFAQSFEPEIELGQTRFVWLGTTRRFSAFTFDFVHTPHGLWRLHAYASGAELSTLVVETTEDTWRRAGLRGCSEAETAAFCADVFADRLAGHAVSTNKSLWRRFPTVTNSQWFHGRYVLLGDAAHTAHFSIGSGTALALKDAIALRDALDGWGAADPLDAALAGYESTRKRSTLRWQQTAASSQRWFEETERCVGLPPLQFAFNLMTRSRRLTHAELEAADPDFTTATDRAFARRAGVAVAEGERPPAPALTPLHLRGLTLPNRLVAEVGGSGSVDRGPGDDAHLAACMASARTGAGLVLTAPTSARDLGRGDDSRRASWARLIDAVRAATDARVGLRLGYPARSPSPTAGAAGASSEALVERLTSDLAHGARLAAAAGFDLLVVRIEPGEALHDLLGPHRWGGSDAGDVEAGMCEALAPIEAVRAAWPTDRPLGVSLSGVEGSAGDPWGAVSSLGHALAERGVDWIHCVAGGASASSRRWALDCAERLRLELGLPTSVAGHFRDLADVDSLLAAGRADLCAPTPGGAFAPSGSAWAARRRA